MKMTLATLAVLVLTGFSPASLAAQDLVEVVSEPTGTELSTLTVLERWRSDPGTIFDASEINMTDLVYVARPVIVFADSPADPLFDRQIALLNADLSGLALRDVIIIADTDPAARSVVRQEYRPRGFTLLLIDRDGRITQRKPAPWDVRELTRAIDKTPSRLQDIRETGALPR